MIKEKRSLRISRETLIGIPALIVLLALSLLAVGFACRDSFLPGTEIAGVRCAWLDAEETAEHILNEAADRSIELLDENGEAFGTVSAAALLPEAELRETVSAALDAQRENASLLSWLVRRGGNSEAKLFSSLRASELVPILSDALYGGGEPARPENAELILGEDGYILQPEEPGSMVDLARCAKCVQVALRGCKTLDAVPDSITVPHGRIIPSVLAASDALRGKILVLENYLSSSITIDFLYGTVYTLTPEDLWHMSDVSQTDSDVTISPNAEKVALLVDGLIEEYGRDNEFAKYAHTAETRKLVYYSPADTGWHMQREALYGDVIHAMILGGQSVITPQYDYTWYMQSLYGCSDTYIEVSLDNQYLWFYVDGQLVVETPVVTGCIANYDFTRRGFFWINAITTDVYLQGPTWYDHVDYWMPFDDQIGLHDSSWRSEYGGDIYLTDGSHGCVNTPLEAMHTIYQYAREGTTVIVY